MDILLGERQDKETVDALAWLGDDPLGSFRLMALVDWTARLEVLRDADTARALLASPTNAGSGGGISSPLPFAVEWREPFREAFGDRWEYAWEVARCESDDFAPDVISGPRLGAGGEKGIFQLHPRGVLPGFLAAGFTDPFDPYQQITFVAAYTLENGWGAWTCAAIVSP